MEQKEIVQILTIKTADSAKNVADLKENISALKQVLNDETATKEQNAKAAELLRANQNALRDAMYATTQSTEQLTDKSKALLGDNKALNGSYNELVHTMAELKMAWRATTDEAERANLGKQIKDINDTLKDMDASVGMFSRNVGDYTNSVKKALGDFPFFADPAKKAIKGVNDTLALTSANPIMGFIALITPLVLKLTESMKEEESTMKSINKVLDAMKPVMDFFEGILGKVVEYVTNIIDKVGEFLGNSGLFNQIVKGVMGIGNTIVQFVIQPFKAVVDAIAVFKEKGLKGFREAASVLWEDVKNGFAFQTNFKTGQTLAENIISGVKDKRDKVKEAGKQFVFDFKEGYDEAWEEVASDDEAYKMFHRDIQERKKAEEEARKERVAREKEMHKEIVQMAEETAKKEKELYDENKKKAEEVAKAKIALQNAVADATSGILGVIADQMELNSKEDEKNAKKVKALRIASATIDTISGAIGAFTQASKTYAPPYGQIIGSTSAALVTATGLANIAKIKSTDVSSGGSGSISAVVSAPQTGNNMTAVRNITTQSEEDRLNLMAKDQRVYILASDIQASNNSTKVQVAESSF